MAKMTTEALRTDVADIKQTLVRLPELLEHVASVATDLQGVKQAFERALHDHDEIFARLRTLESSIVGKTKYEEALERIEKLEMTMERRRWIDNFKEGCIKTIWVVLGSLGLVGVYWLFKMVVTHFPN